MSHFSLSSLRPNYILHGPPLCLQNPSLYPAVRKRKGGKELMPHRKEKDYLLVKNPPRLN